MSGGLLISQPVHQHAYELVVAAQEAGVLEEFVTGMYVSDPSLRWWPFEGPGVVSLLQRQLRRRWHPEIDPLRVRTISRYHVAALAARPALHRCSTSTEVRMQNWAHRAFDRAVGRLLPELTQVRAVHAFEGAALATFEAVHRLGHLAILDVPNAYERMLEVDRNTRVSDNYPTLIKQERSLADFLLVPSLHVSGCLLENGVPSEKIVYIPYGVDVGRFRPSQPNGDVFRVLFVGQVSSRKGVMVLFDAWRRLALPDAELVVVGAVWLTSDELRRMPKNVRLVGAVPKHEVHEWFAGADVFAFPSLCEGSALVTYEAMASSLPVIVTAQSGSVATDGVDGFVVDAADVEALADRLHILYTDRELRVELGRAARRTIEGAYTWRHYRERIRGFYVGLGDLSHRPMSERQADLHVDLQGGVA
jgi:glycosyltransferase involved in cell wall biosynthesis